MGREIRRVPPHWAHPSWNEENARYHENVGKFRPCYDKDYATASAEWKAEFAKWEAGDKSEASYCTEYWEYDSPPDEDTCRPTFTEEPTWWQVYETVSEGTPVTPAFETPEELVDYLATRGDYWDQKRKDRPWQRGPAEAFVMRGGWVPTMAVVDGKPIMGRDLSAETED